MQRSVLAQRYAAAYLNAFGVAYTREHVQRLEQLVQYFQLHKKALFYIKLSCITSSVKKTILLNICSRFGLKDHYGLLCDMLIRHKRLFMIVDVLSCIVHLYKKRQGIIEWVIQSALVLDIAEIEHVYHFLEKKPFI